VATPEIPAATIEQRRNLYSGACYDLLGRMKSLRAFRNASELPIQRKLKALAGRFIGALRPGYAASVREAPFRKQWPVSGRLIRNACLVDAVETADHGLICDFLRDYWSSRASDEFYTGLSHRYKTLFLAYHQSIVAETLGAIQSSESEFTQLAELGAGDGKILDHFSQHLPPGLSFHGVDINLSQVENNRATYENRPMLHFHHADAARWLFEHAKAGTILVTNGGVLEYFTREEVAKIFQTLAETGPCLVVLTESIAADHDLENEPSTYPYGFELSLSHNYIALLEEAGFSIRWVNDRPTTPEESPILGRWLQIVAAKFS